MSASDTAHHCRTRKAWWVGLARGIAATAVTVLASGFMVEPPNTDTFCVTCHAMPPFRIAWQESVHGGNNRQGVAAQCVDCHLPHGNFLRVPHHQGDHRHRRCDSKPDL